MHLWDIIRRHVKDIESRNSIMFADSAWDTFKAMEREIYEWFEKQNRQDQWDALSPVQRQLLREACSSDFGTGVGTWEEDELRQARELERLGYLHSEFNHRHGRYYSFYITIAGRALAQGRK